MGRLAEIDRKPLHVRSIRTTTFSVDAETLLVEGVLEDQRLQEVFSLSAGEMTPPGVVHDLTVRLLVRAGDLTIREVEVEMTRVPGQDCRQLQESLQPLEGRRIAPGFSLWVKENLGGPRGCAHLNALILAMASAAVQGLWVHAAGRPLSARDAVERFGDPAYVVDTCWLWRRDGPRVRRFVRDQEAAGTLRPPGAEGDGDL